MAILPKTSGIPTFEATITEEDILDKTTYWKIGIDTGTEFTTIYATPVRIVMEGNKPRAYRGQTRTQTMPSITGDISLESILATRSIGADKPVRDLLQEQEYILRIEGAKTDRVVGAWAEKEGENYTAAKGLQKRYWGPHALELILTAICSILPTDVHKATVRLVTGLPYSLYKVQANRDKVRKYLEKIHRCTFQGDRKEITIIYGATIVEGYAGFIYAEEKTPLDDGSLNDQLSLDIGGRTANALWANGFTLIPSRCRCEEYGVAHIHDDVRADLLANYQIDFPYAQSQRYLQMMIRGEYLPPIKIAGGYLENAEIRALYDDKIALRWRPIETMLGSMLNKDGASLGSKIRRLILQGGGGHVFLEIVKEFIPSTEIVLLTNAASANARYYHDLIDELGDDDPHFWYRQG